MSSDVDRVVFPGDTQKEIKSVDGIVVIGPGLCRNDENPSTLSVTRPGRLRFKSPNVYWVESRPKRYIPKQTDYVVGIILKKAGDILKVDIGASELASLSILAFEGATKKQKPDMQVGDAVYAQVLTAHKEMEPELVCVDSYGKAGKLGPLSNDGFIINMKPYLVYQFLEAENDVLRRIGRKFPFEVAIGMNGRVWINAKKTGDIFKTIHTLEAYLKSTETEMSRKCKQ